jgi:hypothetical protein
MLIRQILVDYARAPAIAKRDGGIRVDLENVNAVPGIAIEGDETSPLSIAPR